MLDEMPDGVGMSVSGGGRKRAGLLNVFDGIEAIFYGIGGLVVLVLALIKGTAAAQNVAGPLGGGAVIAGCLLLVSLTARDVRRRRWSVVSIGLAIVYAIAVGALIVGDAVAVS
jgi:hypothetical protein